MQVIAINAIACECVESDLKTQYEKADSVFLAEIGKSISFCDIWGQEVKEKHYSPYGNTYSNNLCGYGGEISLVKPYKYYKSDWLKPGEKVRDFKHVYVIQSTGNCNMDTIANKKYLIFGKWAGVDLYYTSMCFGSGSVKSNEEAIKELNQLKANIDNENKP